MFAYVPKLLALVPSDTIRTRFVIMAMPLAVVLAGCVPADGTAVDTAIAIPATNTPITLYCQDAGIKDSTCVLNDPKNPYRYVSITDANKWDLADAAPSETAKYYLWATAMANNPTGENQFYTGLALQGLYSTILDLNGRDQAKRAYRSVLDNYFGSITQAKVSAPTEFVADTDFTYSSWTSGSTLNGSYTGDSGYSQVWKITKASTGGALLAMAFSGADNAAKTALFDAQKLQALTFKYKSDDGSPFTVKLVGTSELDITVGIAAGYVNVAGVTANAISGKTGWYQVTIDLPTVRPSRTDLNAFAIFDIDSSFPVGQSIYLNDIGFTEVSGVNHAKDTNSDGYIYLYQPGATTLVPTPLRDWTGGKLVEPAGSNTEKQLFITQAEAIATLNQWGYVYDISANTTRKK